MSTMPEFADDRATPWLQTVLMQLGWAAFYAGAVWIGRLTTVDGVSALIWPAAAVGVLWAIHAVSRHVPLALPIGFMFALTAALNMATGAPLRHALMMGAVNVIQSFAFALLRARLQRDAGEPADSISSLRSGMTFGAAAIVATVAGTVAGVAAISITTGSLAWQAAGPWFLRNLASIGLFAFPLMRLTMPGALRRDLSKDLRRRGGLEFTLLVAMGLGIEFAVFMQAANFPLAFVPVLVAVWAGSRFTLSTSSGVMMAGGAIAIYATIMGTGPFGAYPPGTRATLVQAHALVAAIVVMVVGLYREERSAALLKLRAMLEARERDIALRTSVFEASHDVVMVFGRHGELLMRNGAAHQLVPGIAMGVPREEWLARFTATSPYDDTPLRPEDLPIGRALQGEAVTGIEMKVMGEDGLSARVFDVSATPLPEAQGMPWSHGVALSARDVTEKFHDRRMLADATAELARSEALFHTSFDTAPMAMFMLEAQGPRAGQIVEANGSAARFLDREERHFKKKALADFAYGDDRATLLRWIESAEDAVWSDARAEIRFVSGEGLLLWGRISATVVDEPSKDGQRFMLCLIEDVTARKNAEMRLAHQALHDDLTGLPNRALLRDRLETSLAAAERLEIGQVGVLFCDLDGFKQVNDEYGHPAGDAVLREASKRLSEALRGPDTLARVGGDEFVVLCPGIPGIADLRAVADRLLAAMSDPFTVGDASISVGVSIGITVGSENSNPDALLARADSAMYEAKREGKRRAHMDDDALSVTSARVERLMPELVEAVARNEFTMLGQPVIDLHSGRAIAVETLLRWEHPERGMLAPSEFLDVLEDTPLMSEVGRFALRESCAMAARWRATHGSDSPAVHVNVSGRQLVDGNFTGDVRAALAEAGLPAHLLVLELTETYTAQLRHSLLHDIELLRELGVRIAIDDVGTGFSSLSRITELPVDMLKVDREFVSKMISDERCEAVVRAVIGLASGLRMDVVAEGVEEPEQSAALRQLDCSSAQGYLWSRPLTSSDLDEFLLAQSDSAVTSKRAR